MPALAVQAANSLPATYVVPMDTRSSRMPLDAAAREDDAELLSQVAALLRSDRREEVRAIVLGGGPLGPFRDEAAALDFLTRRLVAQLRPEEVHLFGSRARGDALPSSDFDFLLVLPDGLPPEEYSYERAREPVGNCGVAVEVVPVSWSDYLVGRTQAGTVTAMAVREGRRLYRSARVAREEREAVARTA